MKYKKFYNKKDNKIYFLKMEIITIDNITKQETIYNIIEKSKEQCNHNYCSELLTQYYCIECGYKLYSLHKCNNCNEIYEKNDFKCNNYISQKLIDALDIYPEIMIKRINF